jgi:hypothetical protein
VGGCGEKFLRPVEKGEESFVAGAVGDEEFHRLAVILESGFFATLGMKI